MSKIRVLVVGDIFGRPGRQIFHDLLPGLIRKHRVDFVIANGENASGGRGITSKSADEILQSPVNVLTTGNHIWEHDSIKPYFETHPILRPHNVDSALPGKGWGVFTSSSGCRICVVSLQGTVFMDDKGMKATNPFQSMDLLLKDVSPISDLIIVDFHAEATSEKRALAWYLDGRVSALLGTHTHVQTADEEILPGGTAYISDIGMTGPHASVIGLAKEVAISRFLTGEKKKFKVAEEGLALNAVLCEFSIQTGKTLSVERVKAVN